MGLYFGLPDFHFLAPAHARQPVTLELGGELLDPFAQVALVLGHAPRFREFTGFSQD